MANDISNATTRPAGSATRPRPACEEGLSLLEVAVSLAILAVLLLPLAGVFYTAAAANADNRDYGAAVGLADKALADAESVSYPNLGFYEDQFGACPTTIPGYDGHSAVDLGCSPPVGQGPEVQPVNTSLRVGATHFTLTTYIVWVAGSHPTNSTVRYPDAYKQVDAVVTWHEHSAPAKAVQSILVYPGGLGPYSGSGKNETPADSSGPPPLVTMASVTKPSGSSGQSSLDVTWNQPVAFNGYYAVVGSTSETDLPPAGSSGSGGGWNPAGSTSYDYNSPPTCSSTASTCTDTVGGLAASTTYWFETVAFTADGSQWVVADSGPLSGTTTGAAEDTCRITALTIDQSGQPQSVLETSANRPTAGQLDSPATITAPADGCTGADTVTVSATGTAALGPWPLTYSANPPQYSYTLCPAQNGGQPQAAFTAGSYTFTVAVNGDTQAGVADNVTFSAAHGSPSC